MLKNFLLSYVKRRCPMANFNESPPYYGMPIVIVKFPHDVRKDLGP